MERQLYALVVGAGVVGRATTETLAHHGFAVSAYDVRPSALEGLSATPLVDPGVARHWDLIVVCVPTPTVDGAMATGPLSDALDFTRKQLAQSAGSFTVVAVRSTLVPGTTASLVVPAVTAAAPEGQVGVCYWPSFARERIAREDELNPRLAVFGTDGREQTGELMRKCVSRHGCPVHVVRFEEAELAKHSANLFNALKISYFNAVDDWARALDGRGQPVADIVAAAAEASWNPAYGTRVGTPFGGACLPKDLEGLLQELRRRGLPHVSLLEAIRDVNAAVGARTAVNLDG